VSVLTPLDIAEEILRELAENMEQYRLRGAIETLFPGVPMKVSYGRLMRNLRKRGISVNHVKLWLAWQELINRGICKPIYAVHKRSHNYFVVFVEPSVLEGARLRKRRR